MSSALRRHIGAAFLSVLIALAGSAHAGEAMQLDVAGGTLHGTLEWPDDATAAVLILAGSGPTDRDGNVASLAGKNNSLRYLAEALGMQGIASLRVDKRLVGASTIKGQTERDLRFDTYVGDARLWLDTLQEKTALPTFVLGHSEGALVATLAATDRDVSGLIIVAGAGQPAGDLILEQMQTRLPPRLMTQAQRIVTALEDGRGVNDTPAALAALFRPSVQPYLISWFRHDPAEALSTVRSPILLTYGTTDLQVLPAAGRRLNAANPRSSLHVIEGMNHVLKAASGPMAAQLASYGDPTLPIHPELVAQIMSFVTQHAPSRSQ
ncbi:MAG: alpha/beta fold hydrolase [Pseudomonadota bacterium]